MQPSGAPRVNNAAAGSTCLPDDITPTRRRLGVVEKGKRWKAKVSAMRTSGQINVNPTPNNPNTMTTPNTVNPADGGNLNNTKGRQQLMETSAIKCMENYHTSKGGRSGYWHSTVASTAHENAHWDIDWKRTSFRVCGLGQWRDRASSRSRERSSANGGAADAAAAKLALKPKVERKISKMDADQYKSWQCGPDDPGKFFANGYLAGEKVRSTVLSNKSGPTPRARSGSELRGRNAWSGVGSRVLGSRGDPGDPQDPTLFRLIHVENLLRGRDASACRWRVGFKVASIIPDRAFGKIGKGGERSSTSTHPRIELG